MKEIVATSAMRMLTELLEQKTGQVLSESRLWRLETALGPVMRGRAIHSLEALADAIRADATGGLATQAVDALLNNETSFFRDAHIFSMIENTLIPEAIARAQAQGRERVLRIWCAGCSTGQEAWSLAMLFENGRARWPDWRLEILATDISHSAIARAQSGIVPQIEAQRGLPVSEMLRWMEPEGDDWRIGPALRGKVDFRCENLIDPKVPSGDYDLILCRNVLLYFTPERKRDLFSVLARHSAPGSWLLLGAGETTIDLTTDFAACPDHRGAYRRVDPA